jgi:hypothetical protein
MSCEGSCFPEWKDLLFSWFHYRPIRRPYCVNKYKDFFVIPDTFPVIPDSDRRISFPRGTRPLICPWRQEKKGCRGQNGVFLPLGSGCRAQIGALVCPRSEIKGSREQNRPLACPASRPRGSRRGCRRTSGKGGAFRLGCWTSNASFLAVSFGAV